MARKSLVSVVETGLLDRIVGQVYAIGAPLPSEAELAADFDVSRLTVREAMRSLSSQGVIEVVPGVRSSVQPAENWTSLDALMRYRSAHGGDDVAVQLVAVRRMFETEAAALAAARITDADLDTLAACVDTMRAASEAGEVGAFVEADLRFHDIIMRRSDNVFLATLFAPLTRILADRRTQTSRVPEIQRNAIVEHGRVLDALRARDAVAARAAMDGHMQQTLDDLQTYVLSPRAPTD